MALDPRIHHPRGLGSARRARFARPAARQPACADSEQAAAADFPAPGAG